MSETEKFTYDYPMSSLAVDIIVHDLKNEHFLFIRRKNNPFQGKMALPGGFVNYGEKIEDAAARELVEETGLSGIFNEVCVLSEPNRDSRGRVVSFVFHVCCKLEDMKNAIAMDDALCIEILKRKEINEAEQFAFDHYNAIEKYLFPKYHGIFL